MSDIFLSEGGSKHPALKFESINDSHAGKVIEVTKLEDRDPNGELKADKYSAKMLIDEGYNPSQLFFAQNLCLTHSPERKDKFEKFLNDIKIKR